MKVLHLETGRHLYGGARQVGYLLAGLHERGVHNVLVCQAGSPLVSSSAVAECIGIPVAGDFDLTLQHRIEQLIRQHQPDIVHVHSRRGGDIFGGRAARATGVPAVLTRRVDSPETAAWLRWKLRPYAAVVAISATIHRHLNRVGVAAPQPELIWSAVDTARFVPDAGARERLLARYALAPESRVVGMAAQFIARKGHALLIPLVASLREEFPGLRLLLFGQGPQRSRLERQVRAAALGDVIRFCGFEQDWPALLPGLELLLHPAAREGLGNAILEAMAAGVPVAASASGGIADVIDDGRDGFLLPHDDLRAWTQTVGRLLRGDVDTAALARAAQHTVRERFTIGRMAHSYMTLYEQVCGRDA